MDAAGFTDINSRLGKTISGVRIAVPSQIQLDGDALKFTWDPPVKHVEPKPQILDSFVELWRQSPRDVLKFASRWGTLLIGDDGQLGQRWASSPRTEPLDVWHYFSRRAYSVLNIAAKVKEGGLGDLDEWSSFQNLKKWAPRFLARFHQEVSGGTYVAAERGYWLGGKQQVKRDLQTERAFLWYEAELWLHLGKVCFGLEPSKDFEMPWELKISYGSGALGAIALQLALTLCSTDKLFTCSGCGLPYRRDTRNPRVDQANFCKKCRQSGESLKKADARRRHKKAEARRLADQGLSVPEIATQLTTKVMTIKVWLKPRSKKL